RRLDRNWRRLQFVRAGTPALADVIHGASQAVADSEPPLVDDTAPMRLTVRDIAQASCRHYGVSITERLSPRRHAAIVWARHIAMYLAREHTLHSLPEIARLFGGRNHTTVLHAVRRIDAALTGSEPLQGDIAAIRGALGLDAGPLARRARVLCGADASR